MAIKRVGTRSFKKSSAQDEHVGEKK